MPYIPTQAPSDLDTDGLRKFNEEQHTNIARAWTETDKSISGINAALGNPTTGLAGKINRVGDSNIGKLFITGPLERPTPT